MRRTSVPAASTRIAAGLLGLGLLGACASGPPDGTPVPGCPRCGDPVTVTGPDGRGVVLSRLRFPRLPEPPAFPVFATGAAQR